VHLSEKDKAFLNGEFGEAAKLAMSILVRMADVYGTTELMDITQAHIDSCALLSDSNLEFAETLASQGGQVSVPTTLNMIPIDLQNWQRLGVPKEFAAKAHRLAKAYIDMGCIPTWTCAPYQGYLTPRFGQQIAWGESNAIVYANSVLGARTNRYGDFLDICAAITGRVPKVGLHLTENRKGQILLRLVDIPERLLANDLFYVALGQLMGNLVQDKIPVIEGLPKNATSDQLKALGAAAASSGAVALFHAIGVTPEAPTLEEAFQGYPPEETIEVRPSDLQRAWAELSTTAEGEKLDAVVLGCPHFSFAEFRQLAQATEEAKDRARAAEVRFVVLTNQTSYALIQRGDFMDRLTNFGVEIVLDTCAFHSPLISPQTKTIMTNSGKFAYYAPGELNARVVVGSISDCVRSAIAGIVIQEDLPWNAF